MPLPRAAPGTLKWWVIGSIGIALGVARDLVRPVRHAGAALMADDGIPGRRRRERVGRLRGAQPRREGPRLHRPRLGRGLRGGGVDRVPVDLAGSDSARTSVTLRTTSRAVTGDVKTCVVAP